MSTPDQELIALIQQQTMPFVDDPKYANNFYNAMGRMVLMWGRLEKTLDDLLVYSITIAKAHGESRDMCVPLGRRLKLLTSIYNSCPDLKTFSARATSLAEEIKKNGKNRHFIVHASWTGFNDGDPPTLAMKNLHHDSSSFAIRGFTVKIDDLTNMCSNFHLCTAKILSLIMDILDILKKVQGKVVAQTDRPPYKRTSVNNRPKSASMEAPSATKTARDLAICIES